MTWTVAFSGAYDRATVELIRPLVKPETLVLDAGASLGLWTVQLGRLARALGAEVWAFEPIPANVGWLRRNVELNHLSSTVQVHQTALGAQPGLLTMHLEHGAGNAFVVTDRSQDGNAQVPVVRLDDIPRPCPVSFLKVDVEGFELEVLRGARQLLAEDRPAIFGEFSEYWLERRGENLRALLREMHEMDYEVHAVELTRSRPWLERDRAVSAPLDLDAPVLREDLLFLPRR